MSEGPGMKRRMIKSNGEKNGKRRGRPRSELPSGVPNAFAVWIRDNKIEIDQVARAAGVSCSAVYKWRCGSNPPSRKRAKWIESFTRGAVLAGSWDK